MTLSRSAAALFPHTAVVLAPPAPFTSGLWGETSAASASLYFLVIYLYFWVGEKTPTFKRLARRSLGSRTEPPAASLSGTRQTAHCRPSPHSSSKRAASSPVHTLTSEGILLSLDLCLFCCNSVLIRFQIPQIRECESNAGSY